MSKTLMPRNEAEPVNTRNFSSLLTRLRRTAPRTDAAPAVDLPPPVEPPHAPSASAVGLEDMRRSGWFNEQTDEIAPGFSVSADDVVVDVGSGDGGLALFAARRARETILIDRDAARLEQAVASLHQQGRRNARGVPGDAAALALPDGIATRVICTEVLEHVDDPAAAMAELVRIGRPGALYLISVPNAAAERLQLGLAWPIYFEKPNHIRIFDPDEFTRLVEDAGLVIENRSVHGFFWTLHWMLFWQANQDFGTSTPLCDSWVRTWDLVLKSPQGPQIKAALDQMAGHSSAVIARKPG